MRRLAPVSRTTRRGRLTADVDESGGRSFGPHQVQDKKATDRNRATFGSQVSREQFAHQNPGLWVNKGAITGELLA
jgi:hypothetical protein